MRATHAPWLDYLIKVVYTGTSLDTLAQEYKPFEITERNDMQYHLWAKIAAGKPSIKLAKALREFKTWNVILDSAAQIKPFFKQEVPEAELRKYAFKKDVQLCVANPDIPVMAKEGFDGTYTFGDGVFYGGKFAFCIKYEGQLAACTSFDPEERKIVIKQIQGVKKRKKELQPLKWVHAVLSKAIDFAKENDIPAVEIVSVINNHWAKLTFNCLKNNGLYTPSTTLDDAAKMSAEEEQAIREKARHSENIVYGDIHLMPHQGFMLYDVAARKHGFQKNAEGNCVLKTADFKNQ